MDEFICLISVNEMILILDSVTYNFIKSNKQMSSSSATMPVAQSIKSSIETVSSSPKYQNRLIVFFILTAFIAAMQPYSSELFYINPVFVCKGEEGKIFEEDACSRIQSCSISKRVGYIVNPQSITAQLSLYCDSRKHDRNMLQSSFGIGCWLGLIFLGFSDRIGKKITFCISLLLLNMTWIRKQIIKIVQIIGGKTSSVQILIISEVVSGFGQKGIVISSMVLLTRFMKKIDYEWGTIIWLASYHGVSQMMLSAINAYFHDWLIITYTYAVGISVCSIASFFILKEDPVFLFQLGRIDEAKTIIEEVAHHNRTDFEMTKNALSQIGALFETKMQQIEANMQEHRHKYSLMQLVRWEIIQKVLILSLSGYFLFASSKSIELTIQNFKYSYNFNLFLVGFSNFIGFISSVWLIQIETNQKRGLIYTSFLYGLIALLFLFHFCTQNGNVETLIIILLRILTAWACVFFTRLKVDSFPEKYQITIISFIEFFISLSFVSSPFIIQQSIDSHINPIVFMAFLRVILGTVPVVFLIQGRVRLLSSEFEGKGTKVIDQKDNKMKDTISGNQNIYQ